MKNIATGRDPHQINNLRFKKYVRVQLQTFINYHVHLHKIVPLAGDWVSSLLHSGQARQNHHAKNSRGNYRIFDADNANRDNDKINVGGMATPTMIFLIIPMRLVDSLVGLVLEFCTDLAAAWPRTFKRHCRNVS